MRIVAYVVMILAALTLLPWLMVAPMSLMALDSGGSLAAYALIGAMLAYPIWLIYWLRRAWASVKAGSEQSAIVQSIIGAAPALLLVVAMTASSPPKRVT